MGNRVRPRCEACDKSMRPIFQFGAQGAKVRVKDAFICPDDGTLARGRRKVRYLAAR